MSVCETAASCPSCLRSPSNVGSSDAKGNWRRLVFYAYIWYVEYTVLVVSMFLLVLYVFRTHARCWLLCISYSLVCLHRLSIWPTTFPSHWSTVHNVMTFTDALAALWWCILRGRCLRMAFLRIYLAPAVYCAASLLPWEWRLGSSSSLWLPYLPLTETQGTEGKEKAFR